MGAAVSTTRYAAEPTAPYAFAYVTYATALLMLLVLLDLLLGLYHEQQALDHDH